MRRHRLLEQRVIGSDVPLLRAMARRCGAQKVAGRPRKGARSAVNAVSAISRPPCLRRGHPMVSLPVVCRVFWS